MFREIILNDSTLKLLLGVVGLLFALSVVRLFLLIRANRVLRRNIARMEKQSMSLHSDLVAIQHDSKSWREKASRHFDAMRADSGAKLEQADRSQEHLLSSLDDTIQENTRQWQTRSQTLASPSGAWPAADGTLRPSSAVPGKLNHAVPTLPAIETLSNQGLEADVAALREQVHSYRQQCASLQRALALCRRRQVPQQRVPARLSRHP